MSFLFARSLLLFLHSLLQVDDFLGWLVKFLVEQDVEIASYIIKEVLYETAVKEVAVDVQLLLPIDHILVFEGVRGMPHRPIFAFSLGGLVAILLVPVSAYLGLAVTR